MPRSRYRILNNAAPHFLTATINHWLPIFTRTETVNIVLESWRYLQQQSGMEIYGYVILENHLHLVASSGDLSHDIQRFKSYTAKQIINYLEQRREKGVLELLGLFKRAHKIECTSSLGRRQSSSDDRIRRSYAPKAGLYSSESCKARIC